MNIHDLAENIQPPHSIESEHSVIGALIKDAFVFDRVADLLTAADFYDLGHQMIYTTIADMIETGSVVDIVTIAERLGDDKLKRIGGLSYLVQIAQSVPSTANIRVYAQTVLERAKLRRLLVVFNEATSACFNPSAKTAAEIASETELALMQSVDTSHNEPKALSGVFTEAIEYIENRGVCGGLQTGFIDLDRATGGLEPGDMVILAARPSMGKTAFAVNIADNIAKDKKSVAFFSLEMPARQIGLRILSSRTRIPVSEMRGGELNSDHIDNISACMAGVHDQRLMIDDKPAVTVAYIRSKARQLKRKHGLDLIVIDYIGLMTGKGDNRTQELGSISRGLKSMAKELGVPVLALAQLNRGLEQRADKRPVLSDLRDSGEIEQDADIVLMLHRDEYYNNDTHMKGIAECLIRKQRNGALEDVLLTYRGEIMRFENYFGMRPSAPQQSTKKTKGFGYSLD